MLSKATFTKDVQYYKFCLYGFLKNQRFFEPFLLLVFLNSKGLNYTQIGTLYSLRFILRAVFEIPSGMLADALGRRGVMLFSYAMYMGSFAGYYVSTTYVWLLLPTTLFALGDAFRTGTHKAMIFEYLKCKGWEKFKVDYYGHTRSWSQSGSALSSVLAAGILLLSKNYNGIFIYSLVPYTFGFVLLATYPSYLEGTNTLKNNPGKRTKLRQILKDTFSAFTTSTSFRLSVNVSSFSGFYFAAKDYLQVFLSMAVLSIPLLASYPGSQEEREILLIGPSYFILFLLTAFASRWSGKVQRFFPSNPHFVNTLLIAGLGISIGAGLLLSASYQLLASCLFMLILILENLRRPAGIAQIADHFDPQILASVLSIESQLSSTVAAVLSLALGFLADSLNPGYALAIMASVIVLLYPLIKLKTNSQS